MANNNSVAPISSCFLYTKTPGFTRIMTDAIMKGKRIDKNSKEFIEDIALEIKRTKAPPYVLKILNSKNTQLLYVDDILPKAIRVFVAKDIKGSKAYTAFIDVDNCITQNQSTKRYKVNVNLLLAYLFSAKINMMYYCMPGIFAKRSSDIVLEARAFAKMFTHCIDYIGNISVIPENREKCMFISAVYFMKKHLGITDDDKCTEIASKVAAITDSQERVFSILLEGKDLSSINGLVDTMKDIFKLDRLNLTIVVERWNFLYGGSTFLALEFLPSFLTTITDAYTGVFTNNQKTIEKILNKDLVELGKVLIYENSNV